MKSSYIYNLGQLFSKISFSQADKTALIYLYDRYTYQYINVLSEKIANYLIIKGIKKYDVIAIFNNKTPFSYALMIASLKIGATYTNLDSNSPVERLNKMLKLCKPNLLFTFDNIYNKTLECDIDKKIIINYTVLNIDNEIKDVNNLNINEINHEVDGNTPAYIMFTSGSTGFPKGVVISHYNLLNFIEWSKSTYNISNDDVFTNINPLHFDNSVFDFYSSFFTGAALIPVSDELTKQPRKMLDYLNQTKPTVWFSVPSMLVYVLMMRALKESDLPTLKIVTFGGEGFPKSQLRNLWNFWGKRVKFINVYGPTECTCICSSYIVTEKDLQSDELLPLGPIAPNFDFIIVKENNEIAEDEEIGELYIKGPNVGLGYFNNIDKTKEQFVQNPFLNSFRDIVYKSGDLVKFVKSENLLYFCGRVDNQIKRMGYRIELEEIENALASLDYIQENAVVFISNIENGIIIANIVSDNKFTENILKDLGSLLPNYMLPNKFVFYNELPKNQNGKIDRLVLKEMFINKQ